MNTAGRENFGAEELAVCLSHYDLGVLESIKPFPRGSRRSPKVVIEGEKGKFLFKRRVRGRDEPSKVAVTHQLQIFLAGQNFPLPHLIGTRRENNSMLLQDGGIYELFEYIEGTGYNSSLDATYSAGRILGLFHKLLADFRPQWQLPVGGYHDAKAIRQSIRSTVGSLPPEGRPSGEILGEVVENLAQHYERCAARVNEIGLPSWEPQVVHGDWHPGNMLFKGDHVVAVIDYDAARLQQRVIDVANGALQFSIIGGGDDPNAWPPQVDQTRYKRFMRGYDSINVISVAELKTIPHLMCEAMIAEAVLPIAATGSFGRIEGFPFLQMIRRKVEWVLSNADMLVAALHD